MNLDNVRRDDWILAGLAVVLIIVLVAFPWFDVSRSIFGVTVSATAVATDSPDSWAGLLAVIVLLLFIADLIVERVSPQTQLPAIGNSRNHTRFVLAAVAAAFLLLKFLLQISHFGDLGWGFWVAAILTAALLYFAMQARAGTPLSTGLGGPGGRGSGTSGGAVGGPTSTPGGVGTGAGGGTAPPPPAGGPPASTPPAGGSSGPPPSSPPPGV